MVNPAEAELVHLTFRRFLDLGSALLLIRDPRRARHAAHDYATQVPRTATTTQQAPTASGGRASAGQGES